MRHQRGGCLRTRGLCHLLGDRHGRVVELRPVLPPGQVPLQPIGPQEHHGSRGMFRGVSCPRPAAAPTASQPGRYTPTELPDAGPPVDPRPMVIVLAIAAGAVVFWLLYALVRFVFHTQLDVWPLVLFFVLHAGAYLIGFAGFIHQSSVGTAAGWFL